MKKSNGSIKLRRVPQVAILVGMSNSYGRDVLHGIGNYSKIHGPWNIRLDYEFSRWELPPWLRNWRGDGIISRIASPKIREFSRKTGIPVVDLNERTFSLKMPYVFIDQAAVGRLAAEHLLERGFTNFAYIGQRGILWSDDRCRCFHETTAPYAHSFNEFEGTPWTESGGETKSIYRNSVWEAETQKIRRWVLSLPKPCGVMACNSFRGLQFLEICRNVGVAVPEAVAVISGDDEQAVCELTAPSLTAVQLDGETVGHRAAELLDKIMHGENNETEQVLVPPKGIVERNSTMSSAIEDGTLGKALEYIRENARFNITPEDVAEHLHISLRKTQIVFKEKYHRTLHEQIVATKLETVAILLRESDLNATEIAHRSGYNYVQQMSDAFLAQYGMRPGAFRQMHKKANG